jgi:Kef-type K+ transport system membrane component KefB
VALGWAAAAWLMPDSPRLAQIFVGATLAATSIGITARVLKDLGVTQTREGQIVLSGVNRLAVGIAMVPRGEVGLIFAGIGTTLILDGRAILSEGLFSAVIVMVLVTTLAAPIGLRWAFQRTAVSSQE